MKEFVELRHFSFVLVLCGKTKLLNWISLMTISNKRSAKKVCGVINISVSMLINRKSAYSNDFVNIL